MHDSAPVLSRLTTVYDLTQDRMCVSGEQADGRICQLWLTRPLLSKLVVALTDWLEQQPVASRAVDAGQTLPQQGQLKNFAQQAEQQSAVQRLSPGALPVSGSAAETSWLVTEVNLRLSKERVLILFHNGRQSAMLPLQPAEGRQWLQILYNNWSKSDWPVTIWPEWFLPPELTSSPVH